MSLVYSTSIKNTRLAAVVSGVDAGDTFGKLVLGTSTLDGTTSATLGVLATMTLTKPSFSVAAGVATILGIPLSTTASSSGALAKAELRDSDDHVIASGLTVGTSSADIIVSSLAVASGASIVINSAVIVD
jgi:hypothetical protein